LVLTWEFTGGLPETHCGYGSTLKATENLRLFLPGLLRMLNVRTLLDAPCGDFNWMRKVVLDDIAYIGMDVDEENLADAREWSAADFINRDVLTEPLPKADAWLCRDFLQHLPNAGVERALKQFQHGLVPCDIVQQCVEPGHQEGRPVSRGQSVCASVLPAAAAHLDCGPAVRWKVVECVAVG
jgi:hypothetical protein